MATRAQKYQQAALAYLVYGLLYLGGALYVAGAGLSERAAGPGGGAVWFAVGALLVLVFPLLVWKGFKWFTRLLCLLVVVRLVGLAGVILDDAGKRVPMPWGAELPMQYGAAAFLIVAGGTCFMLARAGWDLGRKEVSA